MAVLFDRRVVWGATALVGVIVMAIAITYLVGIDRRDIKDLLDEGRYSESAAAADRYLERNAEDARGQCWAEEALTKAHRTDAGWITSTTASYAGCELSIWRLSVKRIHIFHAALQMIDTRVGRQNGSTHSAARRRDRSDRYASRMKRSIRSLVEEWSAGQFPASADHDQIVTRTPEVRAQCIRGFSAASPLCASDNALYVKASEDLKTIDPVGAYSAASVRASTSFSASSLQLSARRRCRRAA